MKHKNFDMLVKASMKGRKTSSVMFCVFIIISFVLVFVTISMVNQLWYAIDKKVNNHILNREIISVFSQDVSNEYLQSSIEEIKSLENIEDIYQMPTKLSVKDQNENLHNIYDLSYVHKDYSLNIIYGRPFCENETGVAVVPKVINEYNAQKGEITEIFGKDLLGKTLKLEELSGITKEFEVVGTYDTTDPIFSGKEILIPQNDLLALNDEVIESTQNAYVSADKSFIVVVDDSKNTEKAFSNLERITAVYRPKLNIDTDSYNTALIILVAITTTLIILTIVGFYLFLKNDVRMRTEELALYRAIGYKSKDLYYIIFSEYFFLEVISIAISLGVSGLLVLLVINPYLETVFGNTFMQMSININPYFIVAIVVGYIVVTMLVCITAISRTEKIDLTVLLRE